VDIESLGNIGDFVGGIGVIVTLVANSRDLAYAYKGACEMLQLPSNKYLKSG